MKIYPIFWADTFDEWRLVKVFLSQEKAEQYLKGKSDSFWFEEHEVER